MKTLTRTDYLRRIGRVLRAIEADLGAQHSLDDLARVASFSRFHFHRIYRAMTGESVAETTRRLRLTEAARRLAETGEPVTAIAADVGYESVQAFSRAFRAFAGAAPSAFRRRRLRLPGAAGVPIPLHQGEHPMDTQIVETGPLAVLAIRHHGPITAIPETYAALWAWLGRRGLVGRLRECLGVCYGDPHGDPDGFRYYAAAVVDGPVEPDGAVEALTVPGGRWVEHRLIGPYDQIGPAFRRLYGEWLPASGHLPDDRPALEIYRNNPTSTPASQLITDLRVPIR